MAFIRNSADAKFRLFFEIARPRPVYASGLAIPFTVCCFVRRHFFSETCRANLWSWHLARIAKSNFVAFLPPKQWEPPTCHCPRTTSMYLAWIERFYFEWFDFAFLFEVPLKSPNSQSWWLPDHLSLDWILDFGLNCKFDYHYQYRLKT